MYIKNDTDKSSLYAFQGPIGLDGKPVSFSFLFPSKYEMMM